MENIYTFFFAIIGIIVLLIILNFIIGKFYNFHSHWNVLIEDFSFSSKEFYTLIRQELQKKGITNIRFERISLKEGNMFSSRRLYLRIHWKEFHFDLCAAPFGKGFFISWWLLYNFTIIEWLIYKIPFIGPWIHRRLYTVTYYKIDTATMFMKYTHKCVLNVLDGLTISKGSRYIDEEERKPILNDIFSR